jgi:hypothetical protein
MKFTTKDGKKLSVYYKENLLYGRKCPANNKNDAEQKTTKLSVVFL